MDFSEPTPGHYCCRWPAEQIVIDLHHLHRHRDGHVTAEITVRTTLPGIPPVMHNSLFNLHSLPARKSLKTYLAEMVPEVQWITILEEMCADVLRQYREGEPWQEVWTTEEVAPPSYLIYPLIMRNQHNVLFGLGGAGKSMIGQLAMVMLTLPWDEHGTSLRLDGTARCLYLDWETNYGDVLYQVKRICRGGDLPDISYAYRRCYQPLADDLDSIHKTIEESQADLVIVDSIGAAIGGDLNATEPAFRFFNSLRGILADNRTTLLMGHTAKDEKGKRSVYGNAYYTNLPRNIFDIRSSQDESKSVLNIGIWQHKSNPVGYIPPLGLRFSFTETEIVAETQDVRDVPEFMKELSLRVQIIELLKTGSHTVKEMHEQLGGKQDTLSRILRRMKRDGETVLLPGNKWGLAVHEEVEL